MIEETDTTNRINWVLREISVHSEEDFALGYLIGDLFRYATQVAWTKKVSRKIEKRSESELGKERLREIERMGEEYAKGRKPLRIYWTKKDTTDIIDMLRRRLVDMRRKVSRDFHR